MVWTLFLNDPKSYLHFGKLNVDLDFDLNSNEECNKICGKNQNCFAEYFSLTYETTTIDEKDRPIEISLLNHHK